MSPMFTPKRGERDCFCQSQHGLSTLTGIHMLSCGGQGLSHVAILFLVLLYLPVAATFPVLCCRILASALQSMHGERVLG